MRGWPKGTHERRAGAPTAARSARKVCRKYWSSSRGAAGEPKNSNIRALRRAGTARRVCRANVIGREKALKSHERLRLGYLLRLRISDASAIYVPSGHF